MSQSADASREGLGISRRRGVRGNLPRPTHGVNGILLCVSLVALVSLLLGANITSFSPQEVQREHSEIRGVQYLKGNQSSDKPKSVQNGRLLGGLMKSQEGSKGKRGDNDTMRAILRGDFHIVDLQLSNFTRKVHPTVDEMKMGGYMGIKAFFCKLNWDLYKNNPPSYPMYHSLVSASKCDENSVIVDFGTVVKRAREYDKLIKHKQQTQSSSEIDGYVHSMKTSGFVFHESRVGSTLAANSLVAMDPVGHRVYSEASPVTSALTVCNGRTQCDLESNVELLRDVIYLMSRTNDLMEHRQFFKVSSIGSKSISVFRKAFPDVPWIFIYRQPVQTMMSHMDPAKGKRVRNAVCLRSMGHPPDELIKIVSRAGREVNTLSREEFCAAHLASLCESALKEMKESSTGKAVEYDRLVDNLIGHIIPDHFSIEVTDEERERILDVSTIYSKSKSNSKEWIEDSEKKDSRATTQIQAASKLFLEKSYFELHKYN